jgi:hypothetical protein
MHRKKFITGMVALAGIGALGRISSKATTPTPHNKKKKQ